MQRSHNRFRRNSAFQNERMNWRPKLLETSSFSFVFILFFFYSPFAVRR